MKPTLGVKSRGKSVGHPEHETALEIPGVMIIQDRFPSRDVMLTSWSFRKAPVCLLVPGTEEKVSGILNMKPH